MAVYDFRRFVIIELFPLALTVEALQGKTCQDSLLSGGVGHFEPRFRGKGSSLGNIFGFYKTRQILLSESAKLHRATCRRFDTIPACDGWTDGQTDRRTDRQTDGIAVVSTALALRTLRRAVKK